jgi:hypothetical protein
VSLVTGVTGSCHTAKLDQPNTANNLCSQAVRYVLGWTGLDVTRACDTCHK